MLNYYDTWFNKELFPHNTLVFQPRDKYIFIKIY